MRIKTTLSADKSGIIDFNYQHQIQAIIYGFLSRSNPDYAQWLHQQGFVYKKDKRFKLFVFSGIIFNGPIKTIRSNKTNHSNNVANQYNLEESPLLAKEGHGRFLPYLPFNPLLAKEGIKGRLKSHKIQRDSEQLSNNFGSSNGFSFKSSQDNPFTFSFQIASPVDKFIQYLIEGIFHEGNEIVLGRQKLNIHRIETLPDPLSSSSTSRLECYQSPPSEGGEKGEVELVSKGILSLTLRPLESLIFIKKPMPPDQHDIYLFPGDEDYKELLNQNLIHKYDTLYGKPFEGEPLKFSFHAIKGKSVKQFTVFKKGLDGSTKPINIKGTLQPFTVTGPRELIRLGLECGFGQNNSMGCGYVEINRDGQDRQDLRSATNGHE